VDRDERIHLPNVLGQTYHVDVMGGSGHYVYVLQDTSVVEINADGLMKPLSEGQTVIILSFFSLLIKLF
jgi:hypothetical protein